MSHDACRAPISLDAASVFEFVHRVRSRSDTDVGDVVIDFSQCRFASPFGLLMTLYATQQLSVGTGVTIVRSQYGSYLEHVGFYDALTANPKARDVGADDGSTYIPITYVKVDDLRASAAESMHVIQEEVDRISARLASALLRSTTGSAYDILQFSMRELLRNIVEHSRAPVIALAAQYWPSHNQAELAILDGGIGVYRSLSSNARLGVQSEQHALELALLPGVTSATFTRDDDVWSNTGYGLYMTSSFGRILGTFVIASGRTAIVLEGEDRRLEVIPVMGTAVCLNISTSPERLGSISREALLHRGAEMERERAGRATHQTGAASMSKRLGRT